LRSDGFYFDGVGGGDGLGCFEGLGGGEFPVPVGLGARGAGMEFTSFSDCGTTGGTGHGGYLFGGEFFGFHHDIMQLFRGGSMFYIAHS
jgi:hypothetical protein